MAASLRYCQDVWESPPDDDSLDDDDEEVEDEGEPLGMQDIIEAAIDYPETKAEQDLRARFAEADWTANRLEGKL